MPWGELRQPRRDFGEKTRQRLARAAAQLDATAGPEGEAAAAVPFGLVLPARLLGQVRGEAGFHGVEIGRQRERRVALATPTLPLGHLCPLRRHRDACRHASMNRPIREVVQSTAIAAPSASPIEPRSTRSARRSKGVASRLRMASIAPLWLALSGRPAAG